MKNKLRECEILVVGGGASGVCAAVTAARQGADTILIEKNDFLGGAAIVGFHHFICGLYLSGKRKPYTTLNAGIVREIAHCLKVIRPKTTPVRIGKVFALPFLTKDLASLFSSLTKKTSHLKVIKNCQAISAKTENGAIKKVRVRSQKGIFDIAPKVVIDCSGEGIIVSMSGAESQLALAKDRQLSSFAFLVGGLRQIDEMSCIQIPYYLRQAIQKKKLPGYLRFTTFSLSENRREGVFKLSLHPTDGKRNIINVKREANRAYRYLASTLPSLRNSFIKRSSSEILEREGIRLGGEYILSADDVLKARKFFDGIVKNSWPIELWDQKRGPQYHYLREGNYYQIPARCLKSINISNLFSAGRSISVSRAALGSSRVMGTCMSLGEQAALLAVKIL